MMVCLYTPMPKRSNEFQRFIHQVETLLAPHGATVTESKLILDRSTGRTTEVDVIIETAVGPRSVVVGIECRDTRRKGDTIWIEQLDSRRRNLQLDKLVAVARKGFTAGAIAKAHALGIEAIEMKAPKFATWWSSFYGLSHVVVQEVVNPFFCGAVVYLLDDPDGRRISVEESRSISLLAPEDVEVGSLAAAGEFLAQRPHVVEAIKNRLPDDGEFRTVLAALVPAGWAMSIDGKVRAFRKIDFELAAISRRSAVPVERFGYGNAQVATMQHSFEPLKQRATLVIAQNEGEVPRLSVRFDPLARSSSDRRM